MNSHRLFNKLERTVPPHLLKKIINHPFNEELYKGTLSQLRFRTFLEQDKLYLLDFSTSLKNIAERLEDNRYQALFFKLSSGAFNTHLTLHDKYLIKTKAPVFFQPTELITRKIPIVDAYTKYQFKMSAHADIEVAIASLMPCFIIYSYLGLRMRAKLNTNHPYQRWIESYSGENFLSSTESMMDVAEELSKGQDPVIKERMSIAFEKSARFEISIWDAISISDTDDLSSKFLDKKQRTSFLNALPTCDK